MMETCSFHGQPLPCSYCVNIQPVLTVGIDPNVEKIINLLEKISSSLETLVERGNSE